MGILVDRAMMSGNSVRPRDPRSRFRCHNRRRRFVLVVKETIMRAILAWITAIGLAGNGIIMLYDPSLWYALVPGVPETGPLNVHFVRDIGCAYLVAGAALGCFLVDERLRAAVWAGGAFLALHALVHVLDAIGGAEGPERFGPDLAFVVAPAIIVLWLAFARPSTKEKHDAEMADPAPARGL
jgi:hypothetical protein